METVKIGTPLIDLVRLCYRADRPVLLVGGHGVGKSEILKQAAAQMGIEFRVRDLSLMEPPDLVGLPVAKGPNTKYLSPSFLPARGKGLLVFEELNRADRYMRAPCLQLLTSRTLNDYKLPPGWLPVAAVNPADEDYEVAELDPALLSRFVQVKVVADHREWLDWARKDGIDSRVIRYIEKDPSAFDAPGCNPRAWSYVSTLIVAAGKEGIAGSQLRAAIMGSIGDKRGAAFYSTIKQCTMPLEAEEVLENYPGRRMEVRSWISGGHLDLVKATLRAVLKNLQPIGDYQAVRMDRNAWSNLATFFADLPGDLRKSAAEMFNDRSYDFPRLTRARKA